MSQVATASPVSPTARGVERVRRTEARKLGRRSFLRVSAIAGLALAVGAGTAGFLGFVNRLKVTSFGGVVTVAATRVPAPGQNPVRVSEGKFWLVNLQGAEGDVLRVGGAGGLLALYTKCPHLGCSVPWKPAFDGAQVGFPGVTGWFRCPCHQSTYSRAGIRVAGPAPRPMDTMSLIRNEDGSVTVDTGSITRGGEDNPLRAAAYRAPA